MKTGALSSPALDGVWCTMSSRTEHFRKLGKLKNGYLDWFNRDLPWAPTIHTSVDTPLNPSIYSWVRLVHHCTSNQSKGIISILVTQYSKDGPWVDGWKLGHTSCSCLGWCVMHHELQPSMQALTPLSIHQWVHGWGWYTIVQATKQGNLIHTGHTTLQGWTSMDKIKLAHFLLLPGMVYDVPWTPSSR